MAEETKEEKDLAKEDSDEKSIEEIFDELETILKKLESPDTPLEESFGQYEKGMKLVKACSEKIDKVEKQMIILQGEADGES